MNRVCYLMSYPAHVPYLVVSLHTLRHHWSGQVDVHAWPESISYVRRMAMDPRLNIRAVERTPAYKGKNDQFMDKQKMVMGYPADDSVLYLDADTSVHGSLDSIFNHADRSRFIATQFSNWRTNGSVIQARLKRLLDFPVIPRGLVEELLARDLPSVNGGVWCCKPNSPVLPRWHEWTDAVKSIFIADECVLHLMQLVHKHEPFEYDTYIGRWNCSPKYQPAEWPDMSIKIYHYHGDSNMRPDKSQRSFDMWWKLYHECLEGNIGGIREWRADVEATNKWFVKLKKEGHTCLV